MRFNSTAGNSIPKLLCIIAGVLLVAFFLLNRKAEVYRNVGSIISTGLTALQFEQTNRPNQATPDRGANINSFPVSISKPIPPEDTEEDSLHLYNIDVPLETGSIVDMDLKGPEGTDLALGVFNEDGALAYSNNTKSGGNESIRFVVTDNKPITVAVETVAAPQAGKSGQYTLSVTSNSEEKGYLIESFPFAASRPIQGQEKIHMYQTILPVDKGTIVGARLRRVKSPEAAELALHISDEEGIINYSTSKGKDEKEAALTFFNGGRASIIIEVNPVKSHTFNGVKNRGGPPKADSAYTLSVNTKGVERLIETLPYTTSGYMSQTDAEEKKWHWYQIASSVPAGTVISANLSVVGKANMDVTIFVDQDIISYGTGHGIGENEHAELTIKNDSKVYVIIDNVEGEGNYSLTVTNS